jgi:methyl-accepting chemotaxis protein
MSLTPTRRLSVATLLGTAFGTLCLLFAAVAIATWVQTRGIRASIDELVDDRAVKVDLTSGIEIRVAQQARQLRDAVLAGKLDPMSIGPMLDQVAAIAKENSEAMQTLRRMLNTPRGQERFAAMAEARGKFAPLRDRTIELLRGGQFDTATTLLVTEVGAAQDAFSIAAKEMVTFQREQMRKTGERAQTDAARALAIGVGAAALACAIALAFAVAIPRLLMRRLGAEPDDVASVAAAVAAGDLASTVPVRNGDTTSVMASMRTMRDRLADIVGQVRASSDGIATGSTQIASGNADLSRRTEAQAASLQEAAASMEEMSSAVKANAASALEANRRATEASEAATRGGERVGDVVRTMQEIAESSKRIADIIGVIDGIAFQTNILALNAAVEAARAGEQGRGFAVVASEVRSLAQRSSEAAREIRGLIGESMQRVEAGGREVDQARASMSELVDRVHRVAGLISEITSATDQQAGGVAQVGEAVADIDRATQQNAALVEQSAAAAESLRSQAEGLVTLVGAFRVASNASTRQPA